MFRITIALVLLAVPVGERCRGQSGLARKALQAAGRIVKGTPTRASGTAAIVAAGGIAAYDQYLKEGEAVYCIEFDLRGDSSAIRWADVFSKPDVFPILQVEGMGTFLIPEIALNYSGQKVLWTFKIPRIAGGRRCVISLYDDDSTSNQIWNGIAQARWNAKINTHLLVQGIPASGSTSLSFQLVDREVILDSPDLLATYVVDAPRFYLGGDWHSEGNLTGTESANVGFVAFGQLTNK